VITPYRDGPLLVRGPVRIQDQDGAEIVIEREVVALCRCGKSRMRPLCDGTHKLIHFKAPSGLEDGTRAAMHLNGSATPAALNGAGLNGPR
jgi:CDGSH-type Zn-finger protein